MNSTAAVLLNLITAQAPVPGEAILTRINKLLAHAFLQEMVTPNTITLAFN